MAGDDRGIKVLTRVPSNEAAGKKQEINVDVYIQSHELSLLSLLAKKYPDKAIKFAQKSLLTEVST